MTDTVFSQNDKGQVDALALSKHLEIVRTSEGLVFHRVVLGETRICKYFDHLNKSFEGTAVVSKAAVGANIFGWYSMMMVIANRSITQSC